MSAIEKLELRERQRVDALMAQPRSIFVFGSNRAGIHGGGAALDAVTRFGAVFGIGEGQRGCSYALPTKGAQIETLSLDEIAEHVATFLAYAEAHPELTFAVTRVGCGLAGYDDKDIAPFFQHAPANCELPFGWRKP